MNASLATCVPPVVPVLAVVLQGAAAGALVASAVLLRARRRGWTLEAWAITAEWSLLGAGLAGWALIVAALMDGAG